MSDPTNAHKKRYLSRLQHKMQRLVDEMPDSNQDKSRCQSDVDIVGALLVDVDTIERLEAENTKLLTVIREAPPMTENATPCLKEYRRWREMALAALEKNDE